MKKNRSKVFLVSFIVAFLLALTCKQTNVHASESSSLFGKVELIKDWHVFPGKDAKAAGRAISDEAFNTDGWYKTNLPATIMKTLVTNGVYKDLFVGKNLKTVPKEQFASSWIYRKEFNLSGKAPGSYYTLVLRGINYSADIYLNKEQIANKSKITGAFRNFTLDITDYVKEGTNTIAIEVFGPRDGDFTIGFVDWNHPSPDDNMGIWRPVELYKSGAVSIKDSFVSSTVNYKTLKDAELTVESTLTNHSQKSVSGVLRGVIDGRSFEQAVTMGPGEQKRVVFTPDQFEALRFDGNARLWWPNNMGEQYLYQADLEFIIDGRISSRSETSFGIRQVEDYINNQGHRGYMVNGKKILIKGGGWVDELFLHDTPERLEAQVKYLAHMNLNAIRMEGFWGQDQFIFDLCDRYGILIMIGWSCHWEWDEYVGKECDEYGAIKTPAEMTLITDSLQDQVRWLRNHPSIFVWALASDRLPRPELEKRYYEMFKTTDMSRPTLASTKGYKSSVSGDTAVKMLGPYSYVPPVYWFQDKKHGGAYGFNTETGPGAQPPVIESIKKMIPEDTLWPINSTWNFHCNAGAFRNLKTYMNALDKRYGRPKSLEEFDRKAQITNYEAMRAMFESFRARRPNTTGLIQWMANSAWPSMMWQLYDYYLMPTGALYGAKTALKPVQLIYDYSDRSVYLVGDHGYPVPKAKAHILLVDAKGNEVFKTTIDVEGTEGDSPLNIFGFESFRKLKGTNFIVLRLTDESGEVICDNRYWVTKAMDLMRYSDSTWYYTPQSRYANFKDLGKLGETGITYKHTVSEDSGRQVMNIIIENKGAVPAFGLFINVVDPATGESVKPLFLDDNYLILLPGETKTIQGHFARPADSPIEPLVTVTGWNTTG